MSRYATILEAQRSALPPQPHIRDFIRFATLAANSHNTQPWLFRVDGDEVDILPDFSRRLPAVDPDDHHLYVSLGCAAENLLIAANASGRPGVLTIRPGEEATTIHITLGSGSRSDERLCQAIPRRQSTRMDFNGEKASEQELQALKASVRFPEVNVLFLTDQNQMAEALGHIQRGSDAQVESPPLARELKQWFRFNTASGVKTGDGLMWKCFGLPGVPRWLGTRIFDKAFTSASENRKYARQVRSSAGLAVFVADDESPAGWIQAGRCFQRFALTATSLGLLHSHLNMPVEVPEVRKEFSEWLGLAGKRPDLVIRFGKGEPAPMSLRRPLEEVIVS